MASFPGSTHLKPWRSHDLAAVLSHRNVFLKSPVLRRQPLLYQLFPQSVQLSSSFKFLLSSITWAPFSSEEPIISIDDYFGGKLTNI